MVDQTVTIRTVLEDRITRGLTRVNKTFGVTLQGIYRLSSGLGPLNSQFSQLAGILAAGFGAREAIDLARAQVTAERSLLGALNDRVLIQQEILGLASELQEATAIGDENLIPIASLLSNMGVAAQEIPRALRAAVDTSKALGLEVESAAKGIGLALSVNRAGELGERIGELQKLQERGALASEVLNVLEERFGGAAAAAADTDFGDYQRNLNTIGDLAEEIGKILIQILLPAIKQVRVGFEGLVSGLQTPAFQALSEVLIKLTPTITKIGSAVAGTAAALVAFQAATFIFGPLAGILGTIVGLVIAIGANLVPVTAGLVAVTAAIRAFPDLLRSFGSLFDPIINSAKELTSGFREAFQSFSDGKITFQQFWDFVTLRLNNFGTEFQIKVGARLEATFRAVFRTVDGLITFAVNESKAAVLTFSNFFLANIQSASAEAAFAIQNALAGTKLGSALGIEEVPQVVIEAFRFASKSFGQDPLGLKDVIKEAERLAGEGAKEITGAFLDEREKLNARLKALNEERRAQEEEIAVFLERAEAQYTADRIANANQQIQAEREKSREIVDSLREVQAELTRTREGSSGILENLDVNKVTELIRNANDASVDLLKSALSTQVADDFEKRKISATEFFALRRAIESTTVEKEIFSAEELLRIEKERFEALRKEADVLAQRRITLQEAQRTVEAIGADDEFRLQISEDLLNAKREENDNLLSIQQSQKRILELTNNLNTAELNRLLTNQQLNGEQEQFAESLVQGAQEALTTLNEASSRVTDLLQSGQITQTQAIEATRAAQKRFNDEIDAAIDKLRALSAASPELASAFADVVATLEGIRSQGEDLTADGGTFFEGMIEGARATSEEMGNLQRAGQRLGQTLSQQLADGVFDVFVTGEQTLKRFLGQFLLTISRMITQLVVYRAIATALGFVGPLPAPPTGQPTQGLQGGRVGPDGIGRPWASTGPKGQHGAPQTGPRARWAGAATLAAMLVAAPAAANQNPPIHRLSGGSVPGPAVRRDIIPALLSPREWVINNAATHYYGDQIMSAINNRLIPRELLEALQVRGSVNAIASALGRHQTGGQAAGSALDREIGGTEPSITRAYLVADDATAERLLTGGRRAALEFFADNATDINSALGR